jgi:hypothetical protein
MVGRRPASFPADQSGEGSFGVGSLRFIVDPIVKPLKPQSHRRTRSVGQQTNRSQKQTSARNIAQPIRFFSNRNTFPLSVPLEPFRIPSQDHHWLDWLIGKHHKREPTHRLSLLFGALRGRSIPRRTHHALLCATAADRTTAASLENGHLAALDAPAIVMPLRLGLPRHRLPEAERIMPARCPDNRTTPRQRWTPSA